MEGNQSGVIETQSGLFETERQLDQRIAQLNGTLTEAEIEAETYLEWPDETLARSVRELAKDLGDAKGLDALKMATAAMFLIGGLRKYNAGSLEIVRELDNGQKFKIEVTGILPTPDDPRVVLADLDASKETVTEYYDRLEATLRKNKMAREAEEQDENSGDTEV